MPVQPVRGPVAAGSPHAVWSPLSFDAVRLDDAGHLGAWQVTASDGTIDHCVAQLDAAGVLDNLRRAAGAPAGDFQGPLFADSDLYKTLEAVAWDAGRVDRRDWVAGAVALLRAAQEDSGYLNSWFQTTAPGSHYEQLRDGHELYCLGHLVQAAVAWHRTTGDTALLDVAVPFADHALAALADRPDGYGGHPEIETALVELYRETEDEAYLRFARTMVDRRGRNELANEHVGPRYYQDHEPVRTADEATGHAVRQVYLATGVTDLYLEQGDPELLAYAERIWASAHSSKMYVTGGLGARHRDESFGDDHELPAERAYAETCAAIADVMWSWRMLLATGDGRYADAMEWTLLNAVAVGAAVDGCSFFYSNPLQVRTTHAEDKDWNSFVHRAPWFDCACCPPNLGRLVASIGHYVATGTSGQVQLHLYTSGEVRTEDVALAVRTGYPYDGRVVIDADAAAPTTLRLRVPAWAEQWGMAVGGVPVDAEPERGYVAVELPSGTTTVELTLDLTPRVLHPHPHVDAVRGSVAVTRGPVVFALEEVDLPDGVVVEDVQVLPGAIEVVDGVADLDAPVALRARGRRLPGGPRPLYAASPPEPAAGPAGDELDLTLVPYHRWGHRGRGGMRVWLPEATS